MSVMSCAPTAKPDETAARPAPASHIGRPGPQTKAVIALAGDGPRRSSDERLLAGDEGILKP
jgi:hypothetical protein